MSVYFRKLHVFSLWTKGDWSKDEVQQAFELLSSQEQEATFHRAKQRKAKIDERTFKQRTTDEIQRSILTRP